MFVIFKPVDVEVNAHLVKGGSHKITFIITVSLCSTWHLVSMLMFLTLHIVGCFVKFIL